SRQGKGTRSDRRGRRSNCGRRSRRCADRAGGVDARGGEKSSRTCPSGRCRAPQSCVLQFRYVPRLQGAWARVLRGRDRAPDGGEAVSIGALPKNARREAGASPAATVSETPAIDGRGPGARSFGALLRSSQAGPVDSVLAAVVVALIGFGVVMVYSA